MNKWMAALLILLWALTAPAQSPCAAEAFPCYGEKTDTAALVELTNMTGHAICELRIRPEAAGMDADWAGCPNLLGQDGFASEARIGVFFELDAAISDGAFYEICVTLDDGREWTLHRVDAADMREALIRMDEGVAYLIYTSAATGEEVSTLLDELRLLASAEMDSARLPESDGGPENPERGDGDS